MEMKGKRQLHKMQMVLKEAEVEEKEVEEVLEEVRPVEEVEVKPQEEVILHNYKW